VLTSEIECVVLGVDDLGTLDGMPAFHIFANFEKKITNIDDRCAPSMSLFKMMNVLYHFTHSITFRYPVQVFSE
jgi:hypothetical protein